MSSSSEAPGTYYKASLGLKHEVAGDLASDYHSHLIRAFRENGNVLGVPEAGLTFHLAREFGFCYGVDKAVDMAYEARRKFPDRRMFLLAEIIHNPRVNRRLMEMGITFLSGQYRDQRFSMEDITPRDVVLIPAFGTSAGDLVRLRERGAVIVDTTCGSVVHVWKRVERYARDGFTSLVHGKYYHEETLATVSMASARGGPFLVVRDRGETKRVCRFIRGEMSSAELMSEFHSEAMSPAFDPSVHLSRIGVANQTTMLASESLEVAALIGDAIASRDGIEGKEDCLNYRSFDTICSATQDRQDAISELVAGESRPDFVLVIGGYNSSNTGHLLEVAARSCPAWHIEDASCLLDAERISHLVRGDKVACTTSGWLPEGPVRIGLTAGASTPNRAIADAVARVVELRGYEPGVVLPGS